MRFQNLNFNEKKRRDATRFTQKMLDINNEIITFLFDDDDKEKTFWSHKFIENNSQLKLIKTLYFDLRHIILNVEYLS